MAHHGGIRHPRFNRLTRNRLAHNHNGIRAHQPSVDRRSSGSADKIHRDFQDTRFAQSDRGQWLGKRQTPTPEEQTTTQATVIADVGDAAQTTLANPTTTVPAATSEISPPPSEPSTTTSDVSTGTSVTTPVTETAVPSTTEAPVATTSSDSTSMTSTTSTSESSTTSEPASTTTSLSSTETLPSTEPLPTSETAHSSDPPTTTVAAAAAASTSTSSSETPTSESSTTTTTTFLSTTETTSLTSTTTADVPATTTYFGGDGWGGRGGGGGSWTGAGTGTATTGIEQAPTATTTAAAGSGSSLDSETKGKIAGGVVGGVAGIVMLIVLALLLFKRRKAAFQQPRGLPSSEGTATAAGNESAPRSAEMTSRRSSNDPLFAASYFAPAFMKRWRQSNHTTRTDSTLSSSSERGFQKISGRKIPSVLQSGGDGYGGGFGETSPTASEPSSIFPSSPPVQPLTSLSQPPPSHPYGMPLDTSYTREAEESVIFRPSPARTPIAGSSNVSLSNEPHVIPQPSSALPPSIPPRPDLLGRSHPSFDGSRGSRFTESL